MTNHIEAALRALAEHGLRCDMNPTHDMSSLDASEAFWHRYLRMLDANIRQLATNAMEAASTPKECCGNYNYNGDCCGRYVTTTNSAPVDSSLVVGPADSSQGEPDDFGTLNKLCRKAFEIEDGYGDPDSNPKNFRVFRDGFFASYHMCGTPLPSSPQVAVAEVGWLVENGKDAGELRYRTMRQGNIEWTADHLEALRFARREDAERFAEEDEDAWRIAEHAWDHDLRPAAPQSAPKAAEPVGNAVTLRIDVTAQVKEQKIHDKLIELGWAPPQEPRAEHWLEAIRVSQSIFGPLDYLNIEQRARSLAQAEGDGHASDCSVHNEPAYPNGPCDCGAEQAAKGDK